MRADPTVGESPKEARNALNWHVAGTFSPICFKFLNWTGGPTTEWTEIVGNVDMKCGALHQHQTMEREAEGIY